jgi:hypothetical protein
MNSVILFIPVIVPIVLGLLAYLLPRELRAARTGLGLLSAVVILISVIAVASSAGSGARFELSAPALEVNFDLQAPVDVQMPLLLAGAAEILLILLLAFGLPVRARSSEYFFLLLYVSGMVNGVLLSKEPVEMVLFGEVLFVTLFGAVALLALLAAYRSEGEGGQTEEGWAASRIFCLFSLGITRVVKAFARAVFVVVDRGIDALFEKGMVGGTRLLTRGLQVCHNGHYSTYLSWTVGGFIILVWFLTMAAG